MADMTKPTGGDMNGETGTGAAGTGGTTKPDGMAGGRKKTAWMAHVKATMRSHKGMKLKDVLKMAKKTYKKVKRGGASDIVPHPVNGGRRRRSTRRSRRGGQED